MASLLTYLFKISNSLSRGKLQFAKMIQITIIHHKRTEIFNTLMGRQIIYIRLYEHNLRFSFTCIHLYFNIKVFIVHSKIHTMQV